MNLEKFRQDNNINEETIIIDAESMMLAVLLRDKHFGLSFSEAGFEDFQNKVIDFFTSKNIPVEFTYLKENSRNIIKDKYNGLRDGEKLCLTIDDFNALDAELKKSPCVDVCSNNGDFIYQLDKAILEERDNPSVYNGAIQKWTGNPYYIYLLSRLAPDCTIDESVRKTLGRLAGQFEENLEDNESSQYFDSYIVADRLKMPREEKDTKEEQNVGKIYQSAVKISQLPNIEPRVQ